MGRYLHIARRGILRMAVRFKSSMKVLDRFENRVLMTARQAHESYFPARKNNFPEWLLIFAVLKYLDSQTASPRGEIDGLLTDPSIVENREFEKYLNRSIASGQLKGLAVEASAYTGEREFSSEKLAAMVTYLTSRGQTICRSKLKKLLFFCDFTNYCLFSHSISGAGYVRDRFAPEFEDFDARFARLVSDGVVRIENERTRDENVIACDSSIIGTLTMLEIVTTHWVFGNFASLSCEAMKDRVKSEHVYRFTPRDRYVAYEYAGLLKETPRAFA